MNSDSASSAHWALAPCRASGLDDQYFLLVRKSDGSSAVLDGTWRPVLAGLSKFRTLADHAAYISGKIAALKDRHREVEAILAQLVDKGLFQNATDLVEEARRGVAGGGFQEAPRIVITTCERPVALERLLDSLVANEKRFGNRWQYEVIDDSRTVEAQEENRALVQDAGGRLDIDYLGPREQQAFLDRLFGELPEARRSRWLLERDEGETEPTYGLPMNLALLRNAGRRVLMLDDDAVIRAGRLPDGGKVPRFDKHQQAEAFVDIEEARQRFESYDQDPFAAHAAALAAPIGAVIDNIPGATPEESFIGEKLTALGSLDPLRSRVQYTLNGIVGDTGSDNDMWLFSANMQSLQGVAGSDERYRQLKESGRVVYRGSPWPSLYDTGWLHQMTCVGVDVSTYMAPIFPAGRGADGLLGLLLRFLYPKNFGILLPFTLEHLAVGKRSWRFDSETLNFTPSVNGLMGAYLQSLRGLGDLEPASKMAVAAEAMQQRFGSGDSGSSLQGVVNGGYLKYLSNQFRLLSGALDSLEDASPAWQEDVEELRQSIIQRLSAPPGLSSAHEERLRSDLLRYADAIPSWNRLFEYRKSNPD